MADQTEPQSSTATLTPSDPPNPHSSAVDRCAKAWSRTRELVSLIPRKERNRPEFDSFADDQASAAFRNAMPPLIGFENILEYIACVAYAMLHNIMLPNECARLFDAAKFALTVARTEPGARKSSNLL